MGGTGSQGAAGGTAVVTRRALLGATAIGLVAASAQAAPFIETLDVDYLDASRRQIRITLTRSDAAGAPDPTETRAALLGADLFARPDDPAAQFLRRRGPDLIEAWIEAAAFPGIPPFRLALEFRRSAIAGSPAAWVFRVILDEALLGSKVVLGAGAGSPDGVSLWDFLGVASADRLRAALPPGQMAQLLRRWFGLRLSLAMRDQGNEPCLLELVRARAPDVPELCALHWRVAVPPRPRSLAPERAASFVLMSDHIDATALRVGMLTSEVLATKAFSLAGVGAASDVRELFRNPVDAQARRTDAPVVAWALYGLAEGSVHFRNRTGAPPGPPAFEIGRVADNAVLFGTPEPTGPTFTSSQPVPTGIPPDGAAAPPVQAAAVGITQRARAASVAARISEVGLLNAGHPEATIAAYLGEGALWFRGDDGAIEGPIAIKRALIRRSRMDATPTGALPARREGVWTMAFLEPPDLQQVVRTRSGLMELTRQATEAAPGQAGGTRPIAVEARDAGEASDENDLRQLTHMHGEMLLSQLGTTLADVSGQDVVFSRLDFPFSPVTLGMQALALPSPAARGTGHIAFGSVDRPRGVAAERDAFARLTGSFALEGATLDVLRARDMLALKYRFVGLALQVDGAAARIVPAGASGAQVNIRPTRTPTAPGCKPDWLGPAVDTRPLLIVELPPQHLAERAYLRQVPAPPDLPDAPLPPAEGADVTRRGIRHRKAAAYAAGLDALLADASIRIDDKLPAASTGPEADALALRFARFAITVHRALGPAFGDSAIYVGPDQLDALPGEPDPEFRVRLRDLALRFAEDGSSDPVGRLSVLPEVPLTRVEEQQLQSSTGGAPAPDTLRKITEQKAARDPVYRDFREKFVSDGELRRLLPGLPTYQGREQLQQYLRGLAATDLRPIVARLLQVAQDVRTRMQQTEEAFERYTEARLSGVSRLAFRINCDAPDDAQAPPLGPAMPRGGFPFSLAALTTWGEFDLEVVRRAERLFERDRGGLLPPRRSRIPVSDPALLLRHQLWPALPGPEDAAPPKMRGRDRLRQVLADAMEAPSWTQTAIELPFRLHLSPAQDALWMTPGQVPLGIFAKSSAGASYLPGPTVVWSARLDDDPDVPSLRAVWSDDFKPTAFLTPGESPPPRSLSPPPPANDGDAQPRFFRTSLDAFDRHELVSLTALHGLPVRGRRRPHATLPDTLVLADGSQIEPPDGFALADGGTEPLRLDTPSTACVVGAPLCKELNAIYQPAALRAGEMVLTPLGGSLYIDAKFTPPAPALLRTPVPSLPGDGVPLFDALSIEAWRHRVSLGRDISVEVVYKGYLFPCGHRVSLVKLTERLFLRSPYIDLRDPRQLGRPTAYLIQRYFLRVGQPDKRYPASGQPNAGRSWPARRMLILNTATPDLVDPMSDSPPSDPNARPKAGLNGQVFLPGGHGLVFWPRTVPQQGGEVQFRVQIDGQGGAVEMPMLFVDNAAANHPPTLDALCRYYSDHPSVDGQRRVLHGGEKRRYAPENSTGESSLETVEWQLAAEGMQRTAPVPPATENAAWSSLDNHLHDFGALLQGEDQPPFYPRLARANVRLRQVERLTGGSGKPVWVVYDIDYVARGMAAPQGKAVKAVHDIFLRFENQVPLQLGDRGDRTGAVARPESPLIAISRDKGPLGGSLPADPNVSVAGRFAAGLKPETFFDQLNGKVLGIMPIKDVVKIVIGQALDVPVLKETIRYGLATADAATDAAGDAESSIRHRLRNSVLVPLRQAVQWVDEQWEKQVEAVPGKVPEQLRLAYPGIADAKDDLKSRLDLAIASADAGGGEFYVGITDVYEAARRFVDAIGQVAADPLTPLLQSLRGLLTAQVEALTGLPISKLQQAESALRAAPQTVWSALRTRLLDLLTGDSVILPPEIQRLFLVRPPQRSSLPLPNPVQDAFKRALHRGLEALIPAALPTQRPDTAAAGEAFRIAFKEEADALSGDAGLAAQELLAKLGGDGQSAWRAIAGPLAQRLVEQLEGIADALAPLLTGDFQSAAAFLDQLGQLLRRLAATLPELVGLPTLCQASAAAVWTGLQAILPILPATLDQACTLPAEGSLACPPPRQPPIPGAPFSPLGLCRALGQAMGALDCLIAMPALDDAPNAVRQGIEQARAKVSVSAGTLITPLARFDGALVGFHGRLGGALDQHPPPTSLTECINWAASLPTAELMEVLREREAVATELGSTLQAIPAALAELATAIQLLARATLTAAAWAKLLAPAQEALGAMAAGADLMLRLGISTTLLAVRDAAAAVTSLKAQLEKLSAGALPPLLMARVTSLQAFVAQAADSNSIPGRMHALATKLHDTLQILAAAGPPPDAKGLETQAQAVLALSADLAALAQGVESLRDLDGEVIAALPVLLGAGFGDQLASQLLVATAPTLTIGLEPLRHLHAALLNQRNAAYASMVGNGKTVLTKLAGTLLVVPTPPPGDALTVQNDDLALEDAEFGAALAALASPAPDPGVAALATLVQAWQTRKPAALRAFQQAAAVIESAFRGDIGAIIDFSSVRARIEARLKELIPSEVAFAYALDVPLQDFDAGETLGKIFVPKAGAGSRLQISAHASIDLLAVSGRNVHPQLAVRADIGPFAINLLGKTPEVVALHFRGATFSGGAGGNGLKIDFEKVELKKEVKFLEKLQNYLKPRDGSGPYVVPSSGRLGIEAGYSLNLGTITIGTVSFINVSLNAACDLPFGDGDALFRIGLARRDAPFLISAAPYGGGGFLALTANAKGFVGFEASFEFGGVGAFSFGPLQGEGRLTFGIYVKQGSGDDCISGFFFAGGSASIACFSISAALMVEMLQQGGQMRGRATFSYSFSFGLGRISFRVAVAHNMGNGFSSGSGGGRDSAEAWPLRYAQLDTVSDAAPPRLERRRPRNNVRAEVTPMQQDWARYDAYFDPTLSGARA